MINYNDICYHGNRLMYNSNTDLMVMDIIICNIIFEKGHFILQLFAFVHLYMVCTIHGLKEWYKVYVNKIHHTVTVITLVLLSV